MRTVLNYPILIGKVTFNFVYDSFMKVRCNQHKTGNMLLNVKCNKLLEDKYYMLA